jgi:large subunit ribosomal protein L31
MKTAIHPQVYQDATVTCTACKAVFRIPSTKKEIQTEICSNCHPVYTGKYRGVTSSGRVQRFQKAKAAAQQAKAEVKPKKRRLSAEEKLELRAKEATEKIKVEKESKEKAKRTKAVKAAKKTVVKPASAKKAKKKKK